MAADTQVSDTLKRFAVKVTSSSVKERKEILQELKDCVRGKDLPEPAIKGLCKLFYLTLHRYRDAASRRALLSVIEVLVQSQPDAIATNLPPGLLSCGVVSRGVMKSTASGACCALPWTCLIVQTVFPSADRREGEKWKKLVEVQSLLLAEVVGGASGNALKSISKCFNKLWKENPGLVDQYMSTLLSLDQSCVSVPLLGLCVDFCTAHKDITTINKHKAALLDLYVKTVLMSKTRPHQHILDKSGSMLRHMSHTEFKEQLLPSLQKALLRSPENSMPTISCMLASLTLDLSPYALDIGKGISSQLKANNPELMEQAVTALQNLAQQCSDPSAVQDLVKHLFGILGGSEGKLTVVAQKMSVLSGEYFVFLSLICSVGLFGQYTKYMVLHTVCLFYLETIRGTLVHAVCVLSQWTSRLTVDVTSELREWFKKAFTLKTSTSLVRHAYLQAMIGAFKGDALNQAVDFLPLLIQTVEKAAAQNTQHALLSEGVAASVLLCRLSVLDSVPEAKLASFWNLILDEKKPLFTTEKFLSQASEEALCTVLLLCERLFLDQPQRLNNSKSQMYHQATVMALLSRLWRVRKRAQQAVKKLLSSLGGSSLAHGLLGELRVVINKHKILPSDVVYMETGELTEIGRSYVAPRILLDALSVICSVAAQWNDPAETEKLALDILIVIHHPSIVAVRSEMWPSLLSTMKLDAAEFIDKHLEMILPRLLEANTDNQAVQNAVGSLSLLSPTRLLPRVMDHVTQRLSNPALRQVTCQEYAIMQTPEGELYDRSIIMSAQQESTKKGNMKRENKAYSFKEQIIELELQEEIKKKKGIKEEIQLTSKQKEMMQNQLEKESGIRKRLQELDVELQCAVSLLEAALARRPPLIWMHLPGVLQAVLPLLRSPLAAPCVKQVFLHIGVTLMPKELHYLAVLVGHVTLRQLKPECDLDPAWAQEDLNTATQRTISLLHTNTAPQRDGKTGSGAFVLSAPAFSFCFPLLQAVLSQSSGSSEESELMMTRALQVINTHAQLRAKSNDTLADKNGPELLPRVSMLLLLTKVIGTSTPRLQVETHIQIMISSSTLAEQPEIDALLEALLSPCFSVRDAALRGLLEMELALPTDGADANGLKMLRRLWVAKFDVEEEGRALLLVQDLMGVCLVLKLLSKLRTTQQHKVEGRKKPVLVSVTGALFAFEMLCNMLGKLFEPYVVHVLPHLLLCFGDGNQYVREAADDCAKAVMRNLSAHGVKLVLPSLLVALEEESWRTKAGSVELLGAMAYCAPKQLSSCLPNIVPKLTEVLTDSHVKVQKAGQQALRQIGSVIRNPEILAITPILLDALTDPSHKTQHCLQTLLDTKFVHFIDAPSLALIMPIVQRAFQDRSTDTRKMAAQIIGNMYSLTDQKDLSPYLPSVVPGLKASLLDPVPEVRTVSAKALGAMVKGMGESCFDDLLPWLMETLASEQSSVDRSGAAQGLAEVMAALGVEKLDKLMPDVVQTASKVDIASHVRDGYIMMFIYLPLTFGEKFTPYVGPILPCILKALADENEYVRDTALRAGQRIISMYAETAIALLLPELEQGLFDNLWRIRFSSVQLLGDLLFHISGVTGKMTTETASEDDNFGTAQSLTSCCRRNRVLSGLYMGRSDIQLVVRQASLHVWKIVVSNTPRTLREILPTLFTLLLGFLASTCPDKRTIAARTLGDLVKKLGEKILPEIIPILEEGLRSDKSDERQGVCIGLSEIMKSTSKEAVLVFSESLVPTVRKALCDPLEEVREAAAKTFEQLHTTIGHQALDDILPMLLKQLDDDETSEFALDGLKQVMAVKSRSVLPYLVPKLTAPPVNTRVLAFLSAVAGDALTRHLGVILPALLSSLKNKLGSEECLNCQTVVLSVEDEVGQRIIIEDLLEATRGADAGLRQASVTILHGYFSRTRLDYSAHTRRLLSGLMRLMNDPNPEVLNQSWDTINSITKKLDAGSQLSLIDDLHRDIRSAAADVKGQHLPGFCLMVNITGPLIRILGDRFAWTVKTALLETLTLLLAKVGIALKPFLPQLQTTFLKALQDSSRAVRLRAAESLGQLVSIHSKVDPLFTEQLSAIHNAEDSGVRETMLQALRFVIQGAGAKVDPSIRKNITTTLLGMLGHDEDATRMASAGCVGELCAFLSEEELKSVLQQHVLADVSGVDWMVRHGRSLALAIAVKSAPDQLCSEEYSSSVLEAVLSSATADRIPIACSGIRGMGYLMRHQLHTGGPESISPRVITQFVKCLQNQSSDIRLVTERVLWWVCKEAETPALEPNLVKPVIKALLDNTKDKNTSVRAQSEHTLVSLLQLRRGEDGMQSISAILDSASNELLSECYRRSLKKISSLPDSNEEIDDTILT
uniref:EIF-2-alpha kinase activator GCN1-like n=1 Tax=Sinocyclocheilus anshuiensis TaxID=1608454 RepID=A0A671S892_9TELE